MTRDECITGLTRLQCVIELLEHDIPYRMLETPDGISIENLISNQIVEWRNKLRDGRSLE